MEYPLINIKNIFVYKALPATMNDRVQKLPASVVIDLPPSTGFANIDKQVKSEIIKTIDWATIAERRLTNCALVDTFAALVHEHSYKRLGFYTKALGNRYNSLVLGHAITALMGITAGEFVTQYVMMMIRDIKQRTNLNRQEIAEFLQFTQPQTYSQFVRTYGNRF